MSQETQIASPDRGAETIDLTWRGLYRIGGAASFGIALMYLFAMAVYVPAMRKAPPPITVLDWFTLLQKDPLTGLFYLGFADILIVILFGPVCLALRAALERVSRPWTTIGVDLVAAMVMVPLPNGPPQLAVVGVNLSRVLAEQVALLGG